MGPTWSNYVQVSPSFLCRTGMSKSGREGDLHNFSRVWTQLALELLAGSLINIFNIIVDYFFHAKAWSLKNRQSLDNLDMFSQHLTASANRATCFLVMLKELRFTLLFNTFHIYLIYLDLCHSLHVPCPWFHDSSLITTSIELPRTKHWSHAWRTSWCAKVTGLKRDLSPWFKIHRARRWSQVQTWCFNLFQIMLNHAPGFQWVPMASAPPLGACRMHCWELPACTWHDFDVNDAQSQRIVKFFVCFLSSAARCC